MNDSKRPHPGLHSASNDESAGDSKNPGVGDGSGDGTDAEKTIDEPVMDGATETFTGTEDPRKGQSDPALIRHPEEGKKSVNPYD